MCLVLGLGDTAPPAIVSEWDVVVWKFAREYGIGKGESQIACVECR